MRNSEKLTAARGRILQFEQNGEFFYRRGQNKLDSNRLPDAVSMYRRALDRDPENIEIKLSLAETLTEMCRYEESNRLLYRLVFRDDCPSEVFFGIGCNLVGIYDYDGARDAFEKYLDADSDGEFAPDACDMLDALEEDGLVDAAAEQEDIAADEGKELLEQDDYKGAIEVLTGLLKKQPKLTYARNNLALAYFCDRRTDEALEQANAVLLQEPDNIQAHCNLTIFLRAKRDKEGVKREADYLEGAQIEDTDDINRVSVTLMEIGRFKAAYPLANRLYQRMPYDTGVIHRLAVCAYENGDYYRAMGCYERLLKLNGKDSIARYYRGVCRAAIAGVPKKKRGFVLNYQVPLDEMLARVHKLNDIINRPPDEMLAMWTGGEELESLILWGLDLPEDSVKHAMLALVGSFGDKKAEYFLRDYVMREDSPNDLKREAFGLLKQMGAEEPYVGVVDGRIVESKVNLISWPVVDVPESFQEVLDACFTSMQMERSEDSIAAAAAIWGDYVGNLESFPRLSQQKIYAFAAALEYAACRKGGESATKTSLCRKYGVTLARFNNALGQLMDKDRKI